MAPESSTEDLDLNELSSGQDDVKGNAAESSTAGDESDKSTETLLDRFEKTLNPDEGEGEPLDPKSGEDGKAPSDPANPNAEAAKGKEGEGDAEEVPDNLLKPKTRRYVERLRKERDEALAQVSQIEPLKAKAESFDKVQAFCTEARLSKDEVNTGFTIMRLMKHDPLRALEVLKPYYERLQQFSGDLLPEDLQQRVNSGVIDEATARELVRERMQAQLLTHQKTQNEEQAQQSQFEQFTSSVETATNNWEKTQAASDPDYKTLQPYVRREIELTLYRMLGEGKYPKTTQEAVKICDEAKTRVAAELVRFRPKKAQIKPVERGAQISSASTKPKTLLEAFDRVLSE